MVDFNIYDNAFEAEIERIKRSASISSSGAGRRRNSKANERRGTGTGTGTGTTFYHTRLNKKKHDTAILGSDGQEEEVGEQGQRLWSGTTGKGDDDNVEGAGNTSRSLWQPRGEAGKERTSGFADVVARAMEGAKEVVVGGGELEGEGKDKEGGGQ